MNKIENLIEAAKLNELLGKKEEKKSNVVLIVLAMIGVIAEVAAILRMNLKMTKKTMMRISS